jgi:hypothetical protein
MCTELHTQLVVSALSNGSFTLAKVSPIMPVTETATLDSHYITWQHDINRNYPICVVSPKVAKASTMATVSRVAVAGVSTLHFTKVNMANPSHFSMEFLIELLFSFV